MCGVFGAMVQGKRRRKLVGLGRDGAWFLQHRGPQSWGLSIGDGKEIQCHKYEGLVGDSANDKPLLHMKEGYCVISHTRYTTYGSLGLDSTQPLYEEGRHKIALSFNGTIVNSKQLKLEMSDYAFKTDTDTEVIAKMIAHSKRSTVEEAVVETCQKLRGGFAFIVLTGEKLIVARDRFGIRPLELGYLDSSFGEFCLIGSETCAFDQIGAKTIRPIRPGEILEIDSNSTFSADWVDSRKTSLKLCVFEFLYFARPDSLFNDIPIEEHRLQLGKALARECKGKDLAHFIVAVADSGISSGLGYSEESGIPYRRGLIRSRYHGRSFLEPELEAMINTVDMKFNPIRYYMRGKRIILNDDTLVRGTNMKLLTKKSKISGGASTVDVRIPAPPIKFPCYYGIATPTYEELIANDKSLEEITRAIGADSLFYLSLQGMLEALGTNNLCLACLNGEYPDGRPCDYE